MKIKNKINVSSEYQSFMEDYVKLLTLVRDNGYNIGDIFSVSTGFNKEVFTQLLYLIERHSRKNEKTKELFIQGISNEFMFLYIKSRPETRKTSCGDIVTDKVVNLGVFNGEPLTEFGEDFEYSYVKPIEKITRFMESGLLLSTPKGFIVTNTKINPKRVEDILRVASLDKNSQYEASFLTNGDVFLPLWDHEISQELLLALGVDVKNAVRLNQSDIKKELREFVLTSFYIYRKTICEFKDDKQIKITKAQAESIVDYLSTLYNNGILKGDSLDNILNRSMNLGWAFVRGSYSIRPEDFDLTKARINLEEFEEASDGAISAHEFYNRIVDELRLKRAEWRREEEEK